MMELNKIIQGDCLEVMKTLPENSVDSIVTDPPYELGFNYIGIEITPEYIPIIEARLKDKPNLFNGTN